MGKSGTGQKVLKLRRGLICRAAQGEHILFPFFAVGKILLQNIISRVHGKHHTIAGIGTVRAQKAFGAKSGQLRTVCLRGVQQHIVAQGGSFLCEFGQKPQHPGPPKGKDRQPEAHSRDGALQFRQQTAAKGSIPGFFVPLPFRKLPGEKGQIQQKTGLPLANFFL